MNIFIRILSLTMKYSGKKYSEKRGSWTHVSNRKQVDQRVGPKMSSKTFGSGGRTDFGTVPAPPKKKKRAFVHDWKGSKSPTIVNREEREKLMKQKKSEKKRKEVRDHRMKKNSNKMLWLNRGRDQNQSKRGMRKTALGYRGYQLRLEYSLGDRWSGKDQQFVQYPSYKMKIQKDFAAKTGPLVTLRQTKSMIYSITISNHLRPHNGQETLIKQKENLKKNKDRKMRKEQIHN